MASKLSTRVVARRELGAGEVSRMFGLFAEHFDQASPEVFGRDLAAKDWVLLLHDAAGDLQGFSTLALYETEVGGERLSVVYSGDTIVRPACWGTLELSKLWIRSVLAMAEGMARPLYWLLISSGFRTYRFLPVFYKEFYPRYDRPAPESVRKLIDALAVRHFGSDYDPDSGVARFSVGATPLRKGIGEVTAKLLEDPHVAFFVRQNPGHERGDELVCLTEISAENMTAAGLRVAGL